MSSVGEGMSDVASAVAMDLDALRAASANQGMIVRQLKKEGASGDELTAAIAKLKELKLAVEKAEAEEGGADFDRETLDTVLKRRMFVVPSFEIHGGVAGLFDFGPVGAPLKDNIVNVWKRHFIMEENMLQVECTCMTPEQVLETSGHVERFTDLMVKDTTTGECFRADQLLEKHIESMLENKKDPVSPERRDELERYHRLADSYSPEELDLKFEELNIVSPTTGKPLTKSYPFNLMFASTIGPEGTARGFLRPETAQGIFVNFKRLLEFNNGKMPFAGAQIGLGFRNEISPRAGLLRVREFTMAEIEHFVHPDFKDHPKFQNVADVKLVLFPAEKQVGDGKTVEMTIGEAVNSGLVANQTLGYFMARTYLFLTGIGIDPKRLRFRQHLSTEMAHYASDCWDGEIKLSYGWTECVGHADRACYDLKVHSTRTNTELMASRRLDEPIVEQVAIPTFNRSIIGKQFKKEGAKIIQLMEALSKDEALAIEEKLSSEGSATLSGSDVTLTREMVSFKAGEKKITEERYYPSVIEPSFGIGRIVYAVLEHTFYSRAEVEGETSKKKDKKDKGSVERTVFSFNPQVAPIKCIVLPLMRKEAMETEASNIAQTLQDADMRTTVDSSGVAIGRKYARADEIGIPFAITVDVDTLEGKGVTVRERDSQEQVRIPVEQLAATMLTIIRGLTSWEALKQQYPVVGSE